MKIRYRLDKQGRLHVYHTPARKSGAPAAALTSATEHETILDASEVARQMTAALLREVQHPQGRASKQGREN